MASKYLALLLVIGGVLIGGGLLFLKQAATTLPLSMGAKTPAESNENGGRFNFENPKKSAHYESNTPEHESVLAGVPINVVINFNFDLAAPSDIDIIGPDGNDYGVSGRSIIENNKLTLREGMDTSAPNGKYTVKYLACWPDKSCHDGMFQFVVDRDRAQSFTDWRGQKEITISMKEINFSPREVRIDAGTTITWVNNDEVDHYVNTDSHPYHTYFPNQNSNLLTKGQTRSVVFVQPGIYPYHCSAHAEMTGTVLVE